MAHLSGDPDFQRILEARAGMLRDIDAFKKRATRDDHAEGRAEGRSEQNIEIAKKMKAKNFSDKEISELTRLSEKEIKEL